MLHKLYRASCSMDLLSKLTLTQPVIWLALTILITLTTTSSTSQLFLLHRNQDSLKQNLDSLKQADLQRLVESPLFRCFINKYQHFLGHRVKVMKRSFLSSPEEESRVARDDQFADTVGPSEERCDGLMKVWCKYLMAPDYD